MNASHRHAITTKVRDVHTLDFLQDALTRQEEVECEVARARTIAAELASDHADPGKVAIWECVVDALREEQRRLKASIRHLRAGTRRRSNPPRRPPRD